VKTFTTDAGTALRTRFGEYGDRLRLWLARPWSAGRVFRTLALFVAGGAGLLAAAWLAGWSWQRWRRWRRPDEFDPVRRAAGHWLARLRRETVQDGVVADLQRLRYGPKETWAEPQAVFKRAKRARRGARAR
jgi:hypothetical protein